MKHTIVFVSDIQSQDEFISKFDQDRNGSIPFTFIYDIHGKQRSFLLGKQRYQQFMKAVEDVAGKP